MGRPHLMCVSLLVLFISTSTEGKAETLHVPTEFSSIQSAIDEAESGDVVLVAEGRYLERVVMQDGVTLKSAGDESPGELGLRRAERTIIDGSTAKDGAGVTMSDGAVLDGFTVTGIGEYDDEKWQHHHATQGNEQAHEHIGAPGTPGIAVTGVNCEVRNNIVHHIGYTGIGIRATEERPCAPLIEGNICYRNMGGGIGSMYKSTAVIRKNVCFENFYAGIGHDFANPLVVDNTCYGNIRAGIGISEGSCPIVRSNKCYNNRRAGIGIRTLSTTRPIIEDNDCHENDMAGIGTEEGSAPIIRRNRCYRNQLAGIGARMYASAVIIENECYENGTVGIGQETGAVTTLIRNHCHHNKAAGIGFSECRNGQSTLIGNRVIDNAKVAIGIQSGWYVTATRNELSREGEIPPIVMIFAGARARFADNTIQGSGVAGIRVAGELDAVGNKFVCPTPRKGGPPNTGIWALQGSRVTLSNNTFGGWRNDVRNDGEG